MVLAQSVSGWTITSVVVGALALGAGWLLRALDWWRTRTTTTVAAAVATAKHDERFAALETCVRTGFADTQAALHSMNATVIAQNVVLTRQVAICEATRETGGCEASSSRVHLVDLSKKG